MTSVIPLGIDAGGTLIKFAFWNQNQLHTIKLPTAHMQAAAIWIKERFSNASLCVTGGKSLLFQSMLGYETRSMIEFDATCHGVQYLIREQGIALPSFILANAGTGTSIHWIHPDGHSRVGGTGVGGGTILGLSSLLTGIDDYEEIIQLAKQGKTDRVDLKVSHIYEGAVPPIPGDLTASNFGYVLKHPEKQSPEDLLASIMSLVGETVATVSILAAQQHGVSNIVFIGSSFAGNDVLGDVVVRNTEIKGAIPMVLQNGEYSGAIGALLSMTPKGTAVS
ncbi:type II pantothenate kinase [Paenibacillus sp. GP183]|uniref:type II pantothenate kinase n=1 Tax=Paenibacillus sp. GP183 TaxID=1882751 RepID=UPI00089D17F0|nr:type II pantothenate kinase [Paenibacillus sp. GP183]SEC27575.1 pantothenate kinase [Paenibacillus sp. GP183]